MADGSAPRAVPHGLAGVDFHKANNALRPQKLRFGGVGVNVEVLWLRDLLIFRFSIFGYIVIILSLSIVSPVP